MSKRRRYALLLAIALMAASGSLNGCGSSGGNNTALTQTSDAKGNVSVTATFPGTTGVTKSLIPTGTKAIYVKFRLQGSQQLGSSTFYDLKLTPAAPSGNIKLAPGNYYVYAYAYDNEVESNGYPTGRQLAYTGSGGVINLGSNTVNLTFLNGLWTLVDAAGNPSPLILSNGMQLNDVLIGGEMYGVAKAAFDFTKPIGGGSGLLKYRFSTYTSAKVYGGLMSQFIGTANTNAVEASMFNLTQKCSDSSYSQNALPCNPVSGDQMITISGGNSGGSDSYSGGYYEGDILQGDASALLPNAGQSTFTQNGAAIDLMSKLGTSSVAGGTTITGSMVEIIVSSASKTLVTTPSPAKVVAAKVVKAQSGNTAYTGISAIDYSMKLCATKSSPNKGTWQFNSKPVTIGSATCYDYGYFSGYDPVTGQPVTPNAGDFSYGLVPTDLTKLGDYCHQWDYSTSSSTYNTCLKQKPDTGDVYNPYNFRAKKTATKTTIDYGSFKVNFHVQDTLSGTVYVYPFIAKGKAN